MSWYLGAAGTRAGVRQRIVDQTIMADQLSGHAVRQLLLDFIDRLPEGAPGLKIDANGHDGGGSQFLRVEVVPLTLSLDPDPTVLETEGE